jgi:putative ABC transport system permease protein
MTLSTDLRFATRRLWNTPLFTVTAVATLALAIGASVAVFGAVRAVLLRPLPIHEADRVVVITEAASATGQQIKEVSYRNFVDWRAQARSFEAMAAMGSTTWNVDINRTDALTRVKTAAVSASFFDLLGTRPQIGRTIQLADDTIGAERILVLSDAIWRRQFGSDAGIVGTRVVAGDDTFTIVGVMPPGLAYPKGAEAWTPVVPALASMNAQWKVDTLEARHFGLLFVVGRLTRGLEAPEARAELDVIARRLPESNLAAVKVPVVTVTPLLDSIFGQTRYALILLFAMVSVVLLIACANVSSLVLARATALRRAFVVKSALGASRLQLVREWVVEIALISTSAGLIGVLLARLGLRTLISIAPASLPGLEDAGVEGAVLVFALGLCVLSTFACALAPALHTLRQSTLRAAWPGESTAPRRTMAGKGVLVGLQVALATVLLTAAGLLVRSFDQLMRVDLGFQPQHMLTLDVEPQARTNGEYRVAYDSILERVRALPGVEAVGAVYLRPLAHGPIGLDSGYLLEGQRIDQPESWRDNATLNFQAITPGYFDAMRLALRQGRTFTARDTADAPGVAIVSDSTAKRLWPGKDPIGQRLSVAAGATEAGEFPMQTVVGVVGDVRYRGIDDGRLDLYMPASQTRHRVKHLMVRTSGDTREMVKAVQTAVGAVTKRTLVQYVDTMERIAVEAVAPWRFSMVLFVTLAGLGFILATTGLAALVAFAVEQRLRELAVRLAIGATPATLLRVVVWQGSRFAFVGLMIGLGASLVLVDRLGPLLFQVPARDGLTFVGSALLLGSTVVLASALAARRVVGIAPSDAMRLE